MKAEPLIIRLLTAYALGSLVLLLYALLRDDILFTDLSFMKSVGLAPALIVFAVFFVLLNLFALGHKQLQMERVLLFCSMTLYFMLLGYFGYQIWFFLFLCIFIGVGAWYCFGRDAISLRPKVSLSRLVPALAVVWFVFFSVQTVLRYRSFGGDNYDMGVYSQMFYQMAEGNGPLTTVANYYEKSRFVADPSPILYLLLPLYMIFRSMTPYLILQAAALASGVVPLLLICKKRACSEATCLLSGLLYLLSAGIWTGIYYDFHEQSLLAPLLLWGLYFAERNFKIIKRYPIVNAVGVNLDFNTAMKLSSVDGVDYIAAESKVSTLDDVRNALGDRRFDEAQKLLDDISYRDAEWHYLQSIVYYNKNWFMECKNQLEIASSIEPENEKYKKALNNLNLKMSKGGIDGTVETGRTYNNNNNANANQNQQTATNRTYYTRRDDNTCCNICGGLLCADCCCECMGGDLISCC